MAGKKKSNKDNTLRRFLRELTPERREEMRRERIEENKKLTLESQLGYYVGEYIVHNNLPTISTDAIRSRKCIIVSEEDVAENKRLEDDWYSSTRYGGNWDGKTEHGQPDKWEAYHNHNKFLEYKYLPHKFVCYLPTINVENIEEFKKGLINSLWNCDMCSYNLNPENIKIYDEEDGYFTIIEFVLDQVLKMK